MRRREFIIGSAGAVALGSPPVRALASAMPSIFFAHGAPFLATDSERGGQLQTLVGGLPRRPRGIVVVSPHVRAEYVSIAAQGSARHSFPRRFSKRVGDLAYAPPSAEPLARQLRAILHAQRLPLSERAHRAFNHTNWMGLFHMFPAADIPVVEMAMPFAPPARLFALGAALSRLRDDGILLISSGSLTHNLASLFVEQTPQWASDFDQWTAEVLAQREIDAVLDWRAKAPAAEIAHPDDGAHFNVMLYALGAAHAKVTPFNLGFEFGSFSTRDYVFN